MKRSLITPEQSTRKWLITFLSVCLFLSCGDTPAPSSDSEMSVTERIAYDENFAEVIAINARIAEYTKDGTIVIPYEASGLFTYTDGIVPEAALDSAYTDDFVGFAEYKRLVLAKNARLTALYKSFPELKEMPVPVASAMLQYAIVLLEKRDQK